MLLAFFSQLMDENNEKPKNEPPTQHIKTDQSQEHKMSKKESFLNQLAYGIGGDKPNFKKIE